MVPVPLWAFPVVTAWADWIRTIPKSSDCPAFANPLPPRIARPFLDIEEDTDASLSFQNHDPRPQHGRRARPLARHGHEGYGFRQADYRGGELLHPVRARPRSSQGS